MWGWGFNSAGQLGLGNTTSYSSPVQIGAGTTWSSVDAGEYHSLAIKTDGTLWTWGYGLLGQLGDGTNVGKSSPVQIGALTNWTKISGGGNWSMALG
jgi:alpha-tubulin suppressor-like RCC1 family protein